MLNKASLEKRKKVDVVENKPKFVGIITAALCSQHLVSAVEGTVISTAMPTIIGSLHVPSS